MVGADSSRGAFEGIAEEFRRLHRHPLNVGLHLVTTPLGIAALLHLTARISWIAPIALAGVYLGSLLVVLPLRRWLWTGACLLPLVYLAERVLAGTGATIGLVVGAYVGQDIAHHLTGERTFQSSYSDRPNWLRNWLTHNYFLLPLCIDAAIVGRLGDALLSSWAPRRGLLTTRLTSAAERADLDAIGQWALAQNPARDTTTHWWAAQLEPGAREAFERIAGSPTILAMFRERHGAGAFVVDELAGMNEVYVASLSHKNNSDTVFYHDHIDGPFMLYPLASVYRCIVAVNENVQIRTCFPMIPEERTWTTGDVGGFDFNREPHRIEHNPGAVNSDFRITLKLHYCVYPRALGWYGRLLAWLTTQYDIIARKAFLKSLRPQSLVEKALARAILLITDGYQYVGRHVGGNNLAWLAGLGMASGFTPAPVFLAGTSFIHYLLYFGTFYSRDGVSFGTFKRDAMLYKALAIAQMLYLYLRDFQLDPLSLALIAGGVALSGLAARALGMDRAYFGAELGVCDAERTRRFPYGVIPHPMITGNILALVGIGLGPGLRAVPWLVPAHIALYLMVLLQEQLDIHKKVVTPT